MYSDTTLLTNDTKKRRFNSHLTSKEKIYLISAILSVVVLINLALVLNLSNDKKLNKVDDYVNLKSSLKIIDCESGHEQYNITTDSVLGKYKKAAVAVDSVICSTMGKNILQAGGSAVDAAITSGLCNGLVNAQSMGIGGGHFMLIYLKSKNKVIAIDARETAPLASNETMFVNNTKNLSLVGGLASGIPGEIAGYARAHLEGGRLEWQKLFEPVIELCENGLKLSPVLASVLRSYENEIKADEGLKKIYINPETGRVYRENDTVKYLDLAKTFKAISKQGAKAFYNGELTEAIVKENNKNGGIFTMEDFSTYNVSMREPIKVKIADKLTLYTLPSPSSGVLVPFIIKIMEKYNLKPEIQNSTEDLSLFYHRLIESFKHAYAKRSYFGDSDFVDMKELTMNLTNEDYIQKIKDKIDDSKTFDTAYYEPAWHTKKNSGTAHISIIDEDGNAVALTSTVNTFFGAKYAGSSTGIIFNNIMDDFSTPGVPNFFNVPPSEANFIKPTKRAMSSMSPIIVVDENNDVRLVLGASGGTKIITAVATVAIRNLFLDLNIKEAIDMTRIHHQLVPTYIEIEKNFTSALQEGLISRGHELKCANSGSVVQGVERRPNGEIWANSDKRKGGSSDGY